MAIPTETLVAQVAAVHEYRAANPNASVRTIATALGLLKSVVDRYLKTPPLFLPGKVDIIELKARAVALKEHYYGLGIRKGVMAILSELCATYGYAFESMPGIAIVERWFMKIAKIYHCVGKRQVIRGISAIGLRIAR